MFNNKENDLEERPDDMTEEIFEMFNDLDSARQGKITAKIDEHERFQNHVEKACKPVYQNG